jgi:pyruvate formate lyase activating enzyme
MDSKIHFNHTGVPNDTILNNLKKLDRLGKPIIIRIPLIPSYNNSKDNIESTAAFLSSLKSIERVDIIPFHEYGRIKYEELGMKYPLSCIDKNILTQDVLNSTKQVFIDHGLNVQFGG